MTARPAPEDSRARLATVIDQNVMGSGIMEDGIRSSWFNDGSDIVKAIEAAGFVILDPSSEALVERIARADPMFDQLSPYFQRELMFKARRIVAAIAAPGGEPM